MSTDEDNITDVEEVSLTETPNLPAVASGQLGDASNCQDIKLPNRQDALLEANEDRRCVAHRSDGGRCRKFAIYGSTVCRTHGGATKHVKQKARIRVENAQNKLVGKLIEFAFDDTKPPEVQLRAIRDALDRGGLKPPAEVVLSQGESKPYESVFEGIYSGPPGLVPTDELPTEYTGYGPEGLEDPHPPAPAYTDRHSGLEAGAGEAQATSGDSGYGDLHPDYTPRYTDSPSWAEHYESSGHGSARPSRRREFDRDTPRQAPEHHITGEDALRLAADANRQIGALPPMPELESGHKRYLRP